MKNKYFTKEQKIEIINRYFNGEKITNLTRELWLGHPVNNWRHNIYNWIKKYANNKLIVKNKKNISKNKLFNIKFKYNIVMEYLKGISARALSLRIWPNQNPEIQRHVIIDWYNQLISKKLLPKIEFGWQENITGIT